MTTKFDNIKYVIFDLYVYKWKSKLAKNLKKTEDEV